MGKFSDALNVIVGLANAVNDGYFPCKECGELMMLKDGDVLVCPSCGYSIDRDDYEADDYSEYFDEDESEIPAGCMACGGPYPQCKTSCKLFDD